MPRKSQVIMPDNSLEVVPLTGQDLVDTETREATELASLPSRTALAEIKRLEYLETPRRLAEAALGDTTWLQANRDLIAAERAKL